MPGNNFLGEKECEGRERKYRDAYTVKSRLITLQTLQVTRAKIKWCYVKTLSTNLIAFTFY